MTRRRERQDAQASAGRPRRDAGGPLVTALAMLALVSSAAADVPVGTRGEIVERAARYTTYALHTAAGDPLRVLNYLRPEYAVPQCAGDTCSGAVDQHRSSDVFWRVTPACRRVYKSWTGTPYCFGKGQPDGHVPSCADYQAGIDAGHGIGGHQCHYIGAGSPYGGDPDMEGIECAGLACSALGMQYFGSSELDDEGKGLDYLVFADLCCEGSLLVRFGHHVVVVTDFDASTVSCIEATGDNPFAWAQTYPLSHFLNYSSMDSKAVAQCQAGEGSLLAAAEPSGAVRLEWKVAGAPDAGRYEFQCRPAGTGPWRTFEQVDAAPGTGLHVYSAICPTDGGMEFRIRETKLSGRRVSGGETLALARREGRP